MRELKERVMEKEIEKKEEVTKINTKKINKKVVIGITISASILIVLVLISGFKYAKSIGIEQEKQNVIVMASKDKDIAVTENEYFKNVFKEINLELVDPLKVIQSEIVKSGDLSFTMESKKKIASALNTLEKISDKQYALEKPTIADMNNFNMYTDLISICNSIERFNEHFIYAVDNKSNKDLKQSLAEIDNITNIVQKNK